MIRELFLQDLSLWSCVWQSTLLVMIGLVGSFLLRRRPARAFQVLFLAMIAAVVVPAMSVLVKHFELGAFVAKPITPHPISMDLYSAVPFEDTEAMIDSQVNTEAHLDTTLVEGGSTGIDIPWREILLFSWMTATLALLGRLLIAFMNGVCMIRRSHPDVREHIQQALARAKSRLGVKNNLQICASGEIHSPMIWCWSRKVVLLVPRDLNNNVDWVGVICHELAHYKRQDHICGLMAELTACILCWNPLSWLAKKRLIRLSEQACDDWVVAGGQPIENYARSLLNFKPQKQAAFVPAVVHSRMGVAARVRRILQDRCVDPRTGVRWALVVSLITTCSAAAVAFAQTRPAHPTTVIAPETKSTSSVLQAAAAGDINQVKTLLSQGVDINVKDDGGLTPLHHAIKKGHTELARFLIDHGADLEAKEKKWDYTPLLYAVQFGNTEILEVLVNKGVDVNYTPKRDYSPLINVIWGKDECRYNMAKLLVDHGASFDIKAQDGWTVFAYAAWDGCDDVIELFVAKGADISTFHMAACMGDLDRVKDFVERGVRVDAKDEVGWTPLFWAVCMRRSEVTQYLIAQGANVNLRIGQTTALHRAALAGTKDIVQLLITQGADVNARDKRGNTPLHEAFNRKEITDLLIRNGADVNVRNSLGRTPLWIAARRGHIEIVRILIANGADVNAKDGDDKIPLDQAAMEGEWSIVALLVANGAEEEVSSIQVTAALGNVAKVKAFLDNGVDVNARNSGNMTPLHAASANGHREVVELLISKNADVNVKSIYDDTPLHCASGAGHRDVAELLIAKGADINAKSGYSGTPLHWAARNGHMDVAELLISKGAGVNTKTKEGRTALHEAATQGHRSIVELLIGKNADINTKDNQGQTALQLAKENGHSEIVELLKKHGAKEDTSAVLPELPLYSARTFNSKMVFEVFVQETPQSGTNQIGHTPSTIPLEIPACWIWWVWPSNPVENWNLLVREIKRNEIPGLKLNLATDLDLKHLSDLTRLQYLNLSDTQVTDAGLEHLKGLTGLGYLNLSQTAITGSGIEYLKGMADLQKLWLSRTKITDVGIEHIKNLTGLKSLNLNFTKIADASLEYLKDMTGLQTLTLRKTKITDAGLEYLQGMNDLQELDLFDTKITDVGLEHIKDLTGLKSLYLSGTSITDMGLEYLKGMPGLQKLWLSGTKITDTGLEHLQGMSGLKDLVLFNTQITNTGLKHLKGKTSLRNLGLVNTKITDGGLAHLKDMATLQILGLVGTNITDDGLEYLKDLTGLETLNLDFTKITNAGLEHLKGMTGLQTLTLRGTQITDAGLEHLKSIIGLHNLNLVNTKITDTGLEHLKGMSGLQTLRLQDTLVTDAGIKQLKQSLPRLTIN